MIKLSFAPVALAVLAAMALASPVHAFDSLSDSASLTGPNGQICLEAFKGATENTRIQSNLVNSQLAGGAFWQNGTTKVSAPSLTEATLAMCGYIAPVITSQLGASNLSYGLDNYIGIEWRASELGSVEVYQHTFAIFGATGTSFQSTSFLIGFRPTGSVGSDTPTLAIGDTAEITFTFDRAVTIANASAVTATGGSLGTISGSGTVYTATFTPSANSTTSAQITIGNGAFENGSGFTNQDGADANNSVGMTVDTVAPTISIAAFTGAASGDQTAVITLSEPSTDFTLADLTLTNATATLSGAGTSYSAVLTPITDGPIGLSVAAGTFTDAAANDNTASNVVTGSADLTGPTISIAAFTGAASGDQTAVITLSEASTDFTLADLTLTNATATLSGSGTSYSAVLTPITDGPIGLSVAAGTFTDAAANDNTASNVVTGSADLTGPTISIAAFTGAASGDQTAVITLSEPSTDFTLADLTLTNATATLSGSGTSYSAVLTPITDGPIGLSVAAGTFTDAAANDNTASNTVTSTADLTRPTVVIGGVPATYTAGASFTVTVTFSEDVTGFAATDIVATNATVSGLTGSGASYVATVTALDLGGLALSIPENIANDAASNGNLASNAVNIADEAISLTQDVIADYMQTRATQLLGNQPRLSSFLSGNARGRFDGAVTRGTGRLDFASRPEAPIWVMASASWTTADDSESEYLFTAVGTHHKISDTLLLGAMMQVDHLSEDNGVATASGTGWMAGPYFVARSAQQPLYFAGSLLYGETENKISPFGTDEDSFDSMRLLAQLEVAGDLKFGTTTLTPFLDASYIAEKQRAYVDALNNMIPAQDMGLGQIEAGLDVSKTFENSRLWGGVSGIWSETRGSGVSTTSRDESGRARVELGLDHSFSASRRLNMSTYYDGIGVQDFEGYGASFGYEMQF